jgi:hypothetical protein
MFSDESETGRHDWIDTPETNGQKVALRAVLIAICLIAAGFIVHASLSAPADVQYIALVPGL